MAIGDVYEKQEAGWVKVANIAGPPGAGAPLYVTSLPPSPTDGQEVYFAANAAAGVLWHLRYRAASANAHKWEYLGGSDLSVYFDSAQGNINPGTPFNTWNDYGAGVSPRLTVPLAGFYRASFGFRSPGQNNQAMGHVALFNSAGTQLTSPYGNCATSLVAAVAGAHYSPWCEGEFTLAAAGEVHMRFYSTSNYIYDYRGFKITPVRVG